MFLVVCVGVWAGGERWVLYRVVVSGTSRMVIRAMVIIWWKEDAIL